MANTDFSNVVWDTPGFEGVVWDKPEPPRSSLAEIGTGLARGALVGLPTLAGQAMQYMSDPGNKVYEFGKSIVSSAEERGQKPSLSLQPGGRGMVTNALASGAEMLAPALAVPLAIGAGAAAAGASPFIGAGAAITGAGALFGAQAGQATLDKAEKADADPVAAQTAARLNAAQTFVAQTALGAVGGSVFGVLGRQMGSLFTKEVGPLTEATMKALTGTGGVLKPMAKELPLAAAEGVAINMGQAALSQTIENRYGIDNTSPWEVAKEQIGPTLGMTAPLGLLGLVARGAQARSAQARTATLANGESAPEIRAQLAGEYAAALQKVNPDAAAAFRQNANVAIQHKLNMDVDSTMFDAGRVQPPVPPTPEQFAPSQVPGLGFDPTAGRYVTFPDGSRTLASQLTPEQIATLASTIPTESPLRSAPMPDSTEVRTRIEAGRKRIAEQELQALHTQVKESLVAAGEKPAVPLTRKEFAATDAAKDLKGQALAKAYKSYLASPDTQIELMRKDAEAQDALTTREAARLAAEEAAAGTPRNPPPQDTGLPPEPLPGKTAMADALTAAVKKRDEEVAFATRDASKLRDLDAIANITKGAQLADAALRGEVRPDPNAPRSPADLVADWNAAMTANEMDTKAQARVPFEKKMVALGIDKMATHQEQIDALRGVIADKKTSQGMRDRVSMLVGKLEAEMPAKKPEPKTLEVTEAAAAKTDTQVAAAPEGTPTGRQAVLEGLVQPDRPRVEVLEQLHVRAQAEAAALVANPDPVKAEALQTKLTHMAAVERQAKALDDADAALVEPPAQAATLGSNIPPSRPDTARQPPKAAAVTESLPDNTSRFTPEQQKLLDSLKPGQGGRTGALNRMREKADAEMVALLEEQPKNFDKKMEKLVAQADAMEAIRAEALSLDRADRAKAHAAAEAAAAAPRNNELAQGDSGVAALTSVSAIADQAADKIAELRAGFAQRLRAGEKLTPLEQERYEDLNGLARTVDHYTEGKASPSDAGYVESIAKFVYDASRPYKKSLRGTGGEDILARIDGPKMDSPDHVDLGLLAPAALSHKASDVLANLINNGSTPLVKEWATKLHPLLPNTRVVDAGAAPPEAAQRHGGRVPLAEYFPETDEIRIYTGGASENSILHESTHAATLAAIKTAAEVMHAGRRPANQNEARMVKGLAELGEVHAAAMKLPGAKQQYGLDTPAEFVAELSNPQFRAFLQQAPTVWGRVLNAIRRLLGWAEKDGPLLERAIEASEPFFAENRIADNFQAPGTAPLAVEGALARLILAADSDRTPFSKMTDALFAAALPIKTLSYIAHQTRGIPELVATGFSRAVDAHQQATISQRVASNYLRDIGSAYVADVQRVLRAVGDADKAREVQREMAVIGMEASRLGFDYRHAFKDQDGRALDPAAKAGVDDIHRRFTQLQKQHPDAAKMLESGERLNRTFLLDMVATLATNYMDARAGMARRLATELERMAPDDAQRASLEARVRATTLESTFAGKFAKGLDFLDPSLRTATNSKPEFFHDGAAAAVYGRLAEMFKAAAALPEGTPLRTHLAALENMYGLQIKNPYFSLGRDGDYFVKVGFKGVDAAANARIQDVLKGLDMVVGDLTRGDDHAFFRVESASAAQALHDRLVLAGEGKVVDTAWGLQPAKLNAVSGVAPALRTLLSGLDDMVAHTPGMSGEQAAAMRETLTRQILSMLPETASRSASMGRRGIPGYSSNFVTSFARRGEAAVHDIAGAYTARSYSQAAQMRADALEQINRTGSAQARLRAGAVNNEIEKRFSDTMKPVENTHIAQALSLSHSFYLGASPAYFIRTMAQPYLRGLPYIGSKFGFSTSLVEMIRATPVAMQVIANSMRAAMAKDGARGLLGAPIELQGINLPAHEMAFIKNELYLRGELDLGQNSQLLHAALRPGSQKMQDVLRFVALTARGAEMSNRLIMGLAAFRLAHKRPDLLGKDAPTPTEYAIRAIDRGMDNFDPANTDRFTSRHGFAGPITPLFTQFQKFALQTMEQIARTVHDGYFGQDKSPEGLLRAKEAKREFAGLMATTSMMAGALGLPFASAFAGIYNNLMSDEDKPEDVRISIRNWATTAFGKDVGDVLLKGPGTALGVDTATFGLQGLFPGTDFLASRMMFKERADAQMLSMLGPAVSLGVDLVTGASKMADGYWLKGIEAMLPIGLRTFFKTEELARVGYTDAKGNPISVGGRAPGEVGAADIAWRALGFQTADKADQGDAARDSTMNQKLLQHRRGLITDQYIKGLRDPSVLADAGQQLQAFNAANPTQPITGASISGALRSHLTGLALAQASGTGVAVSKRQFPSLVETERFAAMPGR